MKTVGIVSLGCAKNRVDSEVLLALLRARGYAIVPPEKAQIAFVNTCGFIEPAKEESIGTILDLAARKGKGLEKLYVTGCLVQRYADEMKEELPEVDGFLGVNEYERVFEMMESQERPVFRGPGCRFPEADRVLTTTPGTAYVKISDGCDNRCAYCAIPLIRGAYASRPMESILAECERLAKEGVKEVTLIAQDTSRYGTDFAPGTRLLPALLRQVAGMGFEWVRVLYCYPDTVDDALLDTLAHTPHVVPYLDLPLQHINARLLRAMNRRGSPEYIRALVEKCHALGITLRTTMIVGFPGETYEEFQDTLSLIREVGFTSLFTFIYSPREGTPAARLPDPLSREEKAANFQRLVELQNAISAEKQAAYVGKTLRCLVDVVSEDPRHNLNARTAGGRLVHFSGDPALLGSYVRLKITGASTWALFGEPAD